MICKPKSTHLNPRALLYKRFTSLEKSYALNAIYATYDGKYWLFDRASSNFTNINTETYDKAVAKGAKTVAIANNAVYLTYLSNYYNYVAGAWQSRQTPPEDVTVLSALFADIGKYQMNKYYFSGSFDFTIRGEIDGTTTQYIKGNIMPLTALNIRHYNDDINIEVDDLVVINGRLYSVENPTTTQKRMPKRFNVYSATLNSIL